MTTCLRIGWRLRGTLIHACFTTLLLASYCDAQQLDSPELQITSPANGTVVNPGQTITVVVTPSAGQTLAQASIVGADPIGLTQPVSGPPFTFSITVPPGTSIRKYALTAWAIDGQGQTVVSVPISISVESSVSPNALVAQVPRLYFETQGQQLSIAITGKFPDGSFTDVTESSNLSFTSSDASVATVDASGVVTAVGTGSTSIVATYGPPSSGVQVSIPVTVLPPALISSPATLMFGIQVVSTVSKPQPLNITNVSKASLRMLAIKTTGDFSETDDCLSSSPISAGAKCTINVTFAPTSNGSRTGTVRISNSLNVVPVVISSMGTGITDAIPPVTTSTVSPPPNSAGWNNMNVTVTLNSTDNEFSGSSVKQIAYSATGAQPIASTTVNGSSASVAISSEGVTTLTFYATDNAGNIETPKQVVVMLDKTPPSLTCGSPDSLWHPTDVVIPCSATDTLSGLANSSDANFSLSTNVSAGTETSSATTGTRAVCDVAVNCATAGPIVGIKVDKKPPSISITNPGSTSYLLNQAVNAAYACTDGGSGVATCVGTVANGARIDTSSVGTKTFTVNATDNVGNISAPQSAKYSVTYGLCLLYDPSRSVQSGSTIPLKLQLCDASNSDVSASSVVLHATSLVQVSTNSSEVIQASGNANPDNDFRFDATLGPTGGYIFNLSTKGLTTGSYQLTFTASVDPLPHVLTFQVR